MSNTKEPRVRQAVSASNVSSPGSRFIFDVSRHALTDATGESIRLRPQSLAVFELLLRNANEVVSKEDILNKVWTGIAVTDDSVTQCVVDIRRVLGKEHRSLLQTVPKAGYRLCLGAGQSGYPVIGLLDIQDSKVNDYPVVKYAVAKGRINALSFVTGNDLVRRGRVRIVCCVFLLSLILLLAFGNLFHTQELTKTSLQERGPTLAVLPFENVGTEREDSSFSDGITEDIIVLLSRFSELGLVSWSTIAARSNSDERIKAIASDFGVRYLISGSVRHQGSRVRVSVRLTDAQNARLLWSERYDEPVQDVFMIQDRIASEIVSALAVKLTKFETELVQSAPTSNIEAYQLSLLGRSELRKRTRQGNLAAREHFAAAIAQDINYADAYVRLGETYLEEALFGWTEWPARATDKALLLANKAIELGGANARVLGFLAQIHVRTGENDKAQTYLDRAFAFNPNDPSLHETQGLLHLWNGVAENAIYHLKYVLRYDPDSTQASSHLSTAYYVAGKPAEAFATIERLIEKAPNVVFNHIILAAALVELGEVESAKAAAAVVRQQHPFLTADGVSRTEFFSSDEVRQRLRSSLRLAGLD